MRGGAGAFCSPPHGISGLLGFGKSSPKRASVVRMAERPQSEGAAARLDELIHRYGRLVRAAILKVAGPRAETALDDIEQRVRIALWRQLQGEQTITHPSSYLYRVAVRETVRVLRENAGPLTGAGASLEELEQAPSRNPAGDPEGSLMLKELGKEIDAALGALHPERERAVRAHLAGFEVNEIMRTYGWSYQKSRNLVARGMADLRQGLREKGIGGADG